VTEPELTQPLAAILAADVAGYSRLMSGDERATVAALDAARAVAPGPRRWPWARLLRRVFSLEVGAERAN
jgi:hypothetical protein